ncbi:hypothetical protein ACAH01_03430 [Halomicrobium sp. HM KBTZ05]|uniref:hypothetical protein n=1 Tax=Halomicrobium sp. HM KBTZ05 TaxID=3242663 RepID=UPI0035585480
MEYYEMAPVDYSSEGLAFSLRNAILSVLFLFVVRLGAGLARGLLDGEYLIGVVGVLLVFVPTAWLLSIIRAAYF